MSAPTKIARRLVLALTAVLAPLALAACGGSGGSNESAALPKVAPPAGQTWSQVTRATRDGVVMGNPNAPIKLIEFASPTCPHCAEFTTTASGALKRDFVDTGRVSWELRPFMLNAVDLVVTGIINCAGPDRFFPLFENVYATQTTMAEGIQHADQAAAQAAMQRPAAERFPALSSTLGLTSYFAARGVSEADINRCLADPASVTRWQESTDRNMREFEITGTPTFVLNGQVLTGVAGWDGVRQALMAAGAR